MTRSASLEYIFFAPAANPIMSKSVSAADIVTQDCIDSKHIGYTKCLNDRIIVLEILGKHNEDRKDIADKNFAIMRCSNARVIRIYNMHDSDTEYKEAFGIYNESFRCEVGQIVDSTCDFLEDLDVVYGSGIYYFLTEKPAVFWNYHPKNGLRESWYGNGQIRDHRTYKDGMMCGLYERWYENGQIHWQCAYKDDKRHGLCELWHENGQPYARYNYKYERMNGLCKSWYKNGQIHTQSTYKDGTLDGLCKIWHENGQIQTK
jgi:antitoxin component YwqK of YwqJK toxin-antitoxin module